MPHTPARQRDLRPTARRLVPRLALLAVPLLLILSPLLLAPLLVQPVLAGPEEGHEGGTDRQARKRDAAAAGVGRWVPLKSVTDLAGAEHTLEALARGGGVLIAMTSPTCPLSKKYAPTLARIAKAWAPKGVPTVVVDVHGGDDAADFRAFAEAYGLEGTLVHDPERRVAAALGATTTTEVFLLDKARTLVYRGAVDDRYGIGTARESASAHWLADALAALVSGKPVAVGATSAPGCALRVGSGAPRESELTWHGTVQRIVQRHCVSCHRAGGIAPFPLESYPQVVNHAPMMAWVVEERVMPPWFAAEVEPGHENPWINDPTIPKADRDALLEWLRGDHKRGDANDAPTSPTFPETWSIGEPDAVIALPNPVRVKAEGVMPYVNVRVQTNFAQDHWVSGWEVIPGAREVVHHVLVFVERAGRKRPGGELGEFLAAFVPGNGAATYPAGFAKRLPKGATLHFQLHYTPNGKATTDRTRLGLTFLDGKPTQEVRVASIANVRIRIPPHAAEHVERAVLPVPIDAQILAYMPHMHYRGRAFRYESVAADGTRRMLLDVPRYDFNWQLAYRLKTPLEIPAGSRIEVRAVFDNSRDNPYNPDPSQEVRWGLQSTDEMLIGYLEYYLPDLAPGTDLVDARGRPTRAVRSAAADALMRRLDKNGDGVLTIPELPPLGRVMFPHVDKNRDGRVTLEELRDSQLGRR